MTSAAPILSLSLVATDDTESDAIALNDDYATVSIDPITAAMPLMSTGDAVFSLPLVEDDAPLRIAG